MKTISKRNYVKTILISSGLLLLSNVSYAETCWTIMPSTCQLDYRSLDAKNFAQVWGGLTFRGTNVGYVIFHCPMPVQNPPSSGSYEIVVTHENANNSNNFIGLQLRRLNVRSIVNDVSFNTRDSYNEPIGNSNNYFRTYSPRFKLPSGVHTYVIQGYIYRNNYRLYPSMRAVRLCKVY
ncbi:MAG: hypothetical protein OEY52_02860 [Gammaproteobacteria bacterium]|nr:hypothetical protein [Gammaproteobacteria bacterium]